MNSQKSAPVLLPFPVPQGGTPPSNNKETFNFDAADEPTALFHFVKNVLDGFGFACTRGPATPEDAQASILITVWEKP